MKKDFVIVIIALIIVIAVAYFILTRSEVTHSALDKYDNCTILSAKSLYEKMIFNISEENTEIDQNETTQMNVSVNKTVITMTYESLSDGECIIIRDNISMITYSEEDNKTTITFSWYEDQYKKPHVYYYFTGNITDIYKVGDEVEIKLTLKHVDIETNSTKYNIDIFEEQWESEQYFINKVQSILVDKGLKSMDPSIIEKI